LVVTIGEYKGHATISLANSEDDAYPFTFGLAKAKLILQHVEEIRAFVESQESEQQ
jgi:hypothetical protein